MGILIVVENPTRWPLAIPAVQLVAARTYLSDPEWSAQRDTVVFNLCRSYGYQTVGYYVSLLAEARGHRPQPGVATLQDLRERSMVRFVSDDLAELINQSLARIGSGTFVLSIYFGRNMAKRHRRLALALFNQFRAPLLRARFKRLNGGWQMQNIGPIAASEIPESHRPFVTRAAEAYFANRRWSGRARKAPRAHLAILVDPDEAEPPSNERALRLFERSAQRLGMATERIERNDYGRIAEFDALFIRRTTWVNHYSYRFARRAAAAGLVVIDDPESIIRCTNKVFLKERLERIHVPIPRTLIVDEQNRARVGAELGFPCVLKQPDGAFSKGVVKADDEAALHAALDRLLADSELVVAQEFLATEYDWRIGVFDRQPLFACRYFMAPQHWQVLRHEGDEVTGWGRVETVRVEDAPRHVVRTALRAANAMGNGLYGVDLKQSGRRCWVMEVNDNPNIEAGFEDRHLGRELYDRIMGGMLARVEKHRGGTR